MNNIQIENVIDDFEKIYNTDNLQLIVKLKNLSIYLELIKKCSERVKREEKKLAEQSGKLTNE